MKLKHLFYSTAALILSACSAGGKMDYAKAKETCETTMMSIDKGDYQTVIENYYSTEMGGAANTEKLTERFNKMKAATGDLKSYSLKDSSMTSEIGEEAKITLTYEVKHTGVTTTEKFSVVDQGGKYRISNHEVNN
jgi:hypothetical protein